MRSFLLISAGALALCVSALADQSGPTIDHVGVLSGAHWLTISGKGFGTTRPAVVMNNAALPIVSFSSTQVVASYPLALALGSYKLTLKTAQGDDDSTASFVVTIGAPKSVAGNFHADGVVGAGSGFTVTRNSAGNYRVSFPAGSWFGSFPLPVVTAFGPPAPSLRISFLFALGDGSLVFDIDNAGVDVACFFIVMQS